MICPFPSWSLNAGPFSLMSADAIEIGMAGSFEPFNGKADHLDGCSSRRALHSRGPDSGNLVRVAP